MKKAVTLATILFACFSLIPAVGQINTWDRRATVDVPFEFTINNTVLPPGTYAVRLNVQTHGVMLQNEDTHLSAIAFSHDIFFIPSGNATSSKLIFAFDGQRGVLHQVVFENDDHMHDLIHGTEVAELNGEPAT